MGCGTLQEACGLVAMGRLLYFIFFNPDYLGVFSEITVSYYGFQVAEGDFPLIAAKGYFYVHLWKAKTPDLIIL